MAYLLDTQAILWYTQNDSRLSTLAEEVISNLGNKILVSIVSLWEVSIKVNVNKLRINGQTSDLANELKELGFDLVGIDVPTLDTYQNLDLHHKDPFDRLLIAYALTNEHLIISSDKKFDDYPIQRIG
jgi:PIN domain nuclease of toxin-antitoxin system